LAVDQVLQQIYRGVTRLINTANFYIGLYDPARSEVDFVINVSESVIDQHIVTLAADQGLTGYILRTRRSLLFNDNVDEWLAEQGLTFIGEAARSWLGVPMLLGDQVLGVMAVQDYTSPQAYTEHDRDLLQAFSVQAAIAIQNARLFEETTRRVTELQALNTIGQILGSSRELQAQLTEVGEYLLSVLKVDTGFIALYDEQTRLIKFPFCWHEGQPVVPDVRPLGDGLTSKVIENRQPLLIRQLTPEALVALGGIQLSPGDVQKSWLGVPIMVNDQVVGVLSGQAYPANYFDDSSVRFLGTIAANISATLQKSQLFEQTRAARAAAESRLLESEVLQQFSRTVSSTLDIDRVLDALVETLQHRLNLSHVAIALIDYEARHLTTVRGIGSASSMRGLARPLDAVQDDITMDIVRKGLIEVIDGWDDRFDRAIYERGGHADLVRAFVPVRLRDKTIGLFEAGYRRGTRAPISPEEVRMLGSLADQLAIAIDNTRLFNQVQAALAETGKLYMASRELAAAPDLTSMVTIFAESVSVPDINRVVLWLFEYAAGTDELAAATVSAAWYSGEGEPPQLIGTRYSPQAMQAINFTRTPEPLFSNDLATDPRIDPTTAALLRRLKIGASAILPLWVGGHQLGLLLLESEHVHSFVESEIRPFTALAQQMAVAIDNVRLLNQVQTALAETGKLYAASRQLAAAADISSMLAAFVEVVPVADINRVVVWLFDYDTADQLASATVAGVWYSGVGEPPPPVGVRFMPQMLHALKFVQSAEPLFLNDVSADPRIEPEMAAVLRPLKVQAVGVLPLWTGGRQLGLLMLQSEHRHVFTDSEIRPYTSLTQQMAAAIENARLFEQTQRDAEREHTLNRIASRLRNAQSVEQVLNIATQELRLATTASRSVAKIAPTSTGQPPNGNSQAVGSEA
jgi:GAF domain-containing protein